MRIVIGNLKGGAAKTTTTCQLAIWLALLGKGPIAAIDGDTDLATVEWLNLVAAKLASYGGGASSRIDVFDGTGLANMKQVSQIERNGGYKYSLIDVEPKSKILLEAALTDSRHRPVQLVIPANPYLPDLRKLPETLRVAAEVTKTSNAVNPRVLLSKIRFGTNHADSAPAQLEEHGIPRFRTLIPLRESIGYSWGTTIVDAAFADVIKELGIIDAIPTGIRKD